MPGPSVQSLAGLRLAIGVGAWVAPNLTGRLFGLDPQSNPQSVYMARLFGIRDVALGIGALSASPEARRLWLQLGLLSDVADAGAAALARRDGSVSAPVALVLGGVAVAAAASGLAVLAQQD
jgi:hypothetical protein